MTTVGWIGVGAMGKPMALQVKAAGYEVRAFDQNEAQLASLREGGVASAESVSATASRADVVVAMVATPAQCESVLFGDDGALAALRPGATVIIMATVGPGPFEGWTARCAAAGVSLVDAPVSGGVARAQIGDLLTMVGGDPTAVQTVQPILDAVSRAAIVVGNRPGDGQRMKIVNQLLCGVHIAVAGEALGFAEALGLDIEATWKILSQGAATSFMFEDRGQRMVTGAFDDVRSALDIFVKDMGLVADAAHDVSYPTPLASAAEQIYLAGKRQGFGRLDDSSVLEVARGHRSD